jgi:hypothetical protein
VVLVAQFGEVSRVEIERFNLEGEGLDLDQKLPLLRRILSNYLKFNASRPTAKLGK